MINVAWLIWRKGRSSKRIERMWVDITHELRPIELKVSDETVGERKKRLYKEAG
jgi:hypothetical protein